MLKVECEGCGAPYRVDERRVPPGGLKMRCPKCGATFVVRKDEPPSVAVPAPNPSAAASLSTTGAFRSVDSKRTALGLGGPAPAPLPPNPAARRPAPPPESGPEPDLPVIRASNPSRARTFLSAHQPPPPAAPEPPREPDLPAVRPPSVMDLPAARMTPLGRISQPKADAPVDPRLPPPPEPLEEFDADLPVVGRSRSGGSSAVFFPAMARPSTPGGLDRPSAPQRTLPRGSQAARPSRPAPPSELPALFRESSPQAAGPRPVRPPMPPVPPRSPLPPLPPQSLDDFGELPLPPGLTDLAPPAPESFKLPSQPPSIADLPSPAERSNQPAAELTLDKPIGELNLPPGAGRSYPDLPAVLPAQGTEKPALVKHPGAGPMPGIPKPVVDLPAAAPPRAPMGSAPGLPAPRAPMSSAPGLPAPRAPMSSAPGLPAPRAPMGSAPGLPSPAGTADLPAPRQASGRLDLPSVVSKTTLPQGSASKLAGLSLNNLPAIAPPGVTDLPSASGLKVDLPSPAPGLPSVAGSQPPVGRQITGAALGFGEPDLPIIANVLPSAAHPSSAPPSGGPGSMGFGELDLPRVADEQSALPAPLPLQGQLPTPAQAGAHLPAVSQHSQVGLPAVTDPAQHLPAAVDTQQQLPTAAPLQWQLPITSPRADAQELFGDVPADGDGVWPDSPPTNLEGHAFSEPPLSTGPAMSIPSIPAPAAQTRNSLPSMDGELFPKLDGTPAPEQAVTRKTTSGGTDYGEVNLGASEASIPSTQLGAGPALSEPPASLAQPALPPQEHGDDDMEFGAIPQESEERQSAVGQYEPMSAPPVAAPPKPAEEQKAPASVRVSSKRSKAGKIALTVALAVLVGGVSLAATPYGVFGVHLISDTLNAKEHEALLQRTIAQSRKVLQMDTAEKAKTALTLHTTALDQAPRNAPIAAYEAFLGFYREIRFGQDSAIHAHAAASLSRAEDKAKDARYLPLAKAALAASDGQIAKARQVLREVSHRSTNDIDVAVLEGEIELMAGEYKSALTAWEKAAKLEASSRTTFGVARAHQGLGEDEKVRAELAQVLKATPEHVGARLVLAKLEHKQNHDDEAVRLLNEIVGPEETAKTVRSAASKNELVSAYTALGQIHLAHSRMSASEDSFAEALKLNPKDSDALCGFGEVLYREGRYAEALARFEAGIQANPESILAKVGAAKSKIALERLQEAKEILRKLRETQPADPLVAYWLAQVEDALGNKSDVETILVDAIRRNPSSPETIDLYVALAQFLASQGRMAEADAKLAEAKSKLPDSPAIHKALGLVALAAGRLTDAKTEFETALQKDERDLSSLFNLGVTLRRMARFDEAQKYFDQVSNLDKNYPGLALERGVLFEASGQPQRALEMYQEALSKAPNEPDLMLRVGSAEVAAGHASQAEEILRRVLKARPNSAEANHYLGRALLLKGTNLAEALRHLRRASEIDPNRAEYWMYIGWAANDAGQPSTASEALQKSLELDQSLADAYWQRGILLRRQGAVRDAEKDLTKALELKPSRFEAFATLAECFEDQSRWDQAMNAWRRAITADGNQAFWRYKLGRLYYSSGNKGAAGEELTRAVQLAAQKARPPWLWEAYLMLAETNRAANRRQEAIEYYREYLKLAPPDSPFRADALKALQTLGAPAEIH